jgi:hypothetical protein
MGSIFGTGRSSAPAIPAIGVRFTTSLYGRPRAIGYGQTRIAPNIIDYGGFTSKPAAQPGGKGGGGGGGKGQPQSYNYSASFIVSLGEQVSQVLAIYNGNSVDYLTVPPDPFLALLAQIGIVPTKGNTYNVELHNGSLTQTASPYWASAFPAKALAYRGQALAVFPNLPLGSSPSLPNFNFEVLYPINSDIPTLGPDANPADVVADLIANPTYGVAGFSAALFGDLTTAKNYWRATGLLISDAISSATAVNSYLKALMAALNADFRWSNGKLDIVPFGDVAITANGYTYTPNVTPIYDLVQDDLLPNTGSLGSSGGGNTPISFSRTDPKNIKNKIQLEYLDRNTLYNPAIVYAADDASITQTRLRLSDKKQCHFFASIAAARMSASLQLHREAVSGSVYQITVGSKFCLLEALDLITVTEQATQLSRQLFRITEVQENSDRSRTLTLELVPLTAAAPAYGLQALLGAGRNNNAPASSVNTPIFYEPPDQLGNGLALWIGLSGSVPASYGGSEVWLSSDGSTYAQIGTFSGSTRMGVASAILPTFPVSLTGTTIDATNVLGVDLTESAATLANGSYADLAALNTALLIDNEIVAYQNATLTAANKYNLSPLSRGGFGSTIAAHGVNANVMRLDGRYFDWMFTSDRIGQKLYFKFLAFNQFGGGKQQLSDVGAYQYTIMGSALASALPNIQSLRGVFEAGVTKVWWDEIVDFRPVLYEIRKGATWATAQTVAVQAHPPFVTFGDDTYFVGAISYPASGIIVRSPVPSSIAIAGALLSQNIVISRDEQAIGWTGTFSNGCGIQGVNPHAILTLGGAQNILATPNILAVADILSVGGIVPNGNYEIASASVIDVGYVAQCLIGCSYVGSGVPVAQNILSSPNILAEPDILGSVAARYVDVHIEIATALAFNADVFSPADIFAPVDVFSGPAAWGAWQKFVPGVYVARFVKFRVVMSTQDPTIKPVCLGFNYSVTVPARIDHYQNLTIPAGGMTINFQPDRAATPSPFNGGPNNQGLPYLNAVWPNQVGDTLSYTVTKSTAFIQILNAGVGVSRTGVNVDVEGY